MSTVPQVFGYANVVVQSQTSLQGSSTTIIEGSACLVNVAYFNQYGEPFVPNAVRYRVDDVTSGQNIVPLMGIGPIGTTSQVVITAGQNSMISLTRPWEQHQVLLQITDGLGQVYQAKADFYVQSDLY
jgi:hypothetical protein